MCIYVYIYIYVYRGGRSEVVGPSASTVTQTLQTYPVINMQNPMSAKPHLRDARVCEPGADALLHRGRPEEVPLEKLHLYI